MPRSSRGSPHPAQSRSTRARHLRRRQPRRAGRARAGGARSTLAERRPGPCGAPLPWRVSCRTRCPPP
eukprot:4681755-Prymnesium_polylepis.1